jgi:hypothetical protein
LRQCSCTAKSSSHQPIAATSRTRTILALRAESAAEIEVALGSVAEAILQLTKSLNYRRSLSTPLIGAPASPTVDDARLHGSARGTSQ